LSTLQYFVHSLLITAVRVGWYAQRSTTVHRRPASMEVHARPIQLSATSVRVSPALMEQTATSVSLQLNSLRRYGYYCVI